MKMLLRSLIIGIWIIGLGACSGSASLVATTVSLPTLLLTVRSTPTYYQILTQKPLPIAPITPKITPIAEPTATLLPRWVEYERALARTFFHYPAGIIGHGICEWEVLGHAGQEVYVDAMCINLSNAYGSIMRTPAVIYLSSDGDIMSIETPQPGNQYSVDIRKMFPDEVRKRLANPDYSADWRGHLETRKNKDGPPLIVLLGTPMP